MSKKTISGLTIEIGGDTTKLGQALSDVDKQSSALSRELGEINKLLKFDPGNAELLAQKQEVLSEAIRNTQSRLETLKTAHEQASKAAAEGNGAAEETMRALEREIISTEQKLNGYENAARETEDALNGLGNETAETAKSQEELEKAAKEAEEKLKKQQEAAQKARKELGDLAEKGAEKAAKGIAALATAALGAVTALGALVLKEAENADELNDLSTKTGISVEKLQQYSYAAEMAGTSLDVVTGAHAKLIKNMATATKGSGDAAKAFEALGVHVTGVNGELRDSEEIFGEVIDALSGMDNETQRDALAMQIFGKSAQELNPLIKAGSDGIAEYNREAKELGIIVSDETVGALADLQGEVKTTRAQFSAAKQTVAAEFAPVVSNVLQKLQLLIKKGNDQLKQPQARQSIEKLGKAFEKLLDKGVDAAIKLLPKLAKAVEFLIDNFKTLVITLGTLWGIFKGVSVVTSAANAFNTVKKALDALKAASVAAKTAQEGLDAANKAASISTAGWIGIIGAAVAAMALLVKASADSAQKRLEELTATSTEIQQNVQSTIDQMEQARSTYSDTISQSGAAADMADRYIDRLEQLERQGSLTADEQREYNDLILKLRTVMPELNIEIDKNTGMLKNGTTALREQIKQLKEKLRLEAMEDLIKESLKAEVSLQQEKNKAQKEYNKYYGETGRKYREIYDRLASNQAVSADELAFWQSYRGEIGDTSKTLGEFDTEAHAAADALDATGKALNKCQADTDELVDSFTSAADKAGLLGESTEESTGGVKTLTDKVAELNSVAQEAADKHLQKLTDASSNFFEVIDTGSAGSMEEFIEAVRKNREATNEWHDNLIKIAERGAPQEIVDMFEEAGLSAAAKLKTLADATDEEFDELLNEIALSSEDAARRSREWGQRVADGIIAGIASKKEELRRAAAQAANAVSNAFKVTLQIRSPSRVTRGFGRYFDQGAILGIRDDTPALIKEAQQAAAAMSAAFGDGITDPIPEIGAVSTASAHNNTAQQTAAAATWGEKLDRILAAIEAGQILVLDGDTLVGATAERMDEALGGRAVLAGRGKA